MIPAPRLLNLGCGEKKLQGFVDVDVRPALGPDLVCDLKCIVANDVVEHFESVVGLAEECHVFRLRAVKADGTTA